MDYEVEWGNLLHNYKNSGSLDEFFIADGVIQQSGGWNVRKQIQNWGRLVAVIYYVVAVLCH